MTKRTNHDQKKYNDQKTKNDQRQASPKEKNND